MMKPSTTPENGAHIVFAGYGVPDNPGLLKPIGLISGKR
jgi:hypothetical protein